MKKNLHVSIRDKIACCHEQEIVLDNSDYVIVFDFDSEWDEHKYKTMRVTYGMDFTEDVFEGNTVKLPRISDVNSITIGVYAGNIITSTPALVRCRNSVLTVGGSPKPPSEDVYAQIMQILNELHEGDVSPEAITAAVEKYLTENPVEAVTEHPELTQRDLSDQHPISSITGLQAELDNKQPSGNYLTSETDPTVPEWAKQPEKPKYTADEVGALPNTTEIPKLDGYATEQFVKDEIGKIEMPDDGGSGVTDHNSLTGRDEADQHPISAITGLQTALEEKQPKGEYLMYANLQEATNAALAQAKASGEFDGAPGKPGESAYQIAIDKGFQGTEEEWLESLNGKTPQKGIDYFTDSDIAQCAKQAAASIDLNTEIPEFGSDAVPLTWKTGAYISENGTVTSNSAWSYTNKIAISSKFRYFITGAPALIFVSFYNSNSVFIKNSTQPGMGEVIDIPSTASYVTFSVGNNYVSNFNVSLKTGTERTTLSVYSEIIIADNASSHLSNANYAIPNTLYRMQLVSAAIDNFPSNYLYNGDVHYLLTVENTFNAGIQKTQMIFNTAFICKWRRVCEGGVWYSWKALSSRNEITVGNGGAFADLRTAVQYAYSVGDMTVILMPGEHVITDFSGAGLPLGRGIKVVGNPHAVIKAHYAGSDAAIRKTFSVFNAESGDFEVNGLNIEASNVRYCIHDERSGDPDPYRHTCRNCNMFLDNADSTWKAPQCIGGGLGINGFIEIEDCIFDSTVHNANSGLVSYHNNIDAGSKSVLYVKNCFFKGETGTFRAGWYGASTDVSVCYLSNNSFGTAPILRAENDTAAIQNMEIVEWNNHIREV